MTIVAVCVGLPRVLDWHGHAVRTAIVKQPVSGPVLVHPENLAGDGQADRAVHGGLDKAVYAYPSEHYAWWKPRLPEPGAGWGWFGENLTVRGLRESDLGPGDTLACGEVRLQVTQPRLPCFKLAARFGRDDLIRRFIDSGRTGFYLRVLRGGALAAGDPIRVESRDRAGISIAELLRLRFHPNPAPDRVRGALGIAALPRGWREDLRRRLGSHPGGG